MTGTSYQIPDLFSLTKDFELRTNKRCRIAIDESTEWLSGLNLETGIDILAEDEIKRIRGLKSGLLASLCFPTCDLPQLRLAADFINLLLISNERVKAGSLGWDSEGEFERNGFAEVLDHHDLFKHLVPRIARLKTSTTPRWQKQFTTSLLALRDAQFRAVKYRKKKTELIVDDYVDFSRDSSGLRAVFDLVESSEGLNLDITEMRLDDADDFRMLRRHAAEFIALSFDLFSYRNDSRAGSNLNIVQIYLIHEDLSLQSAVSKAGVLIMEKFDVFKALESAIWNRHPRDNKDVTPRNDSLGATLSTWIRRPLSRSSSRTNLAALYSSSEPEKWDTSTMNDASLFLQGLKDSMCGALHWAYESELFFGTKGESIKNFGWVFLQDD